MNKSVPEMIAELESTLHDPKLTKAEYIRVQAVLLRKKKYKRQDIAEIVGKSHSVVENWIIAYNKTGLDGLRTKKRSTPARGLLSPSQRHHLIGQLKKSPVDVKTSITEEYWTLALVKQLVKRETGIVYASDNSYVKLLREAGMSYQKVEFVDKHQDQAQHDNFKKQFESKVKGGRISMWW